MSEREGPKVTIKLSCFGCRYEKSKRYAVQGDSGHDVSCTHPATVDAYIGDSNWDTPGWCPLRAKQLEAVSREMVDE